MQCLFSKVKNSVSPSDELNYRLRIHQLDFLLFRLTYLIDDFKLLVSELNDSDKRFYSLTERLNEIDESIKTLVKN